MRRLIIRVSNNNRKPIRVKLRPGTTCRDILAHLELPGYVLVPADDPSHEFLPSEDVYRKTRDGQGLIARLSTEAADRYILSFFKKAGES